MLHYQVISNNSQLPWMLCLHGAGGNTKTWKYQIADFSKHYQLLIVDLRDHGKSKFFDEQIKKYSFELIAKDVLNVIDQLKIKSLVVLSLSMGSMIAQQMSMMRPSIISYAIYAGGIFKVTLPIRAFATSAKFLAWFIPYPWMYSIFSWLVMPRKNHQYARRVYVRQAALLSQQAFNRWIKLYGEFRGTLLKFFKSDIDIPSLVIMGDQDYIFLKPAFRFVAKSQLRKLEVINNCGHICNIEQAQKFNQIVLRHLSDQ